MRKSSAHMYRWFRTPVGTRMLRQEMELIEQCRREYKGQVMLQVSNAGEPMLGRANLKRVKTVVSPLPPAKNDEKLENYSWAVSELDLLPLEDESVDFMVLHHSLEFSEDPHAVLREATRVLAPQGHLVVVCFNPYSFFGLRKTMQFILRRSIPWAHHALSRTRISDWLKLMNCESRNVAWGFYSFPFQNDLLLKYSEKIDRFLTQQGMPGGGFYVIHACKEVGGWVGSLPVESMGGRLVKFPVTVATRTCQSRTERENEY